MKRNYIVDLSKGIGIFLVVLGHNPSALTNYIYSFHMPLFFLLSGICHSKEEKYIKFLEKKIKSLLVPYVLFSIILFLFWVIIGRKFGEASLKNTPIYHSFFGVFIGTDIPGISSIEWGTPLWFLLCLFIVNNIFFFISKKNNYLIILINIILILLNITLSKYLTTRLPWSILTSLVALPFYTIGYLFKKEILNKEINKSYWVVTILCIIASVISCNINGRVDMFGNTYKNILIFFIGGFSGSIFIVNITKLVSEDKFKWISFLGINSLLILAFHGRAMTFIKLIWKIILNQNFIEGYFMLAFIYSCLQIILCLPLIFITNKYFPILAGKAIKK